MPLLAKYPGRLSPEGTTLEAFHVAASLVASRAFGVDEWHGAPCVLAQCTARTAAGLGTLQSILHVCPSCCCR